MRSSDFVSVLKHQRDGISERIDLDLDRFRNSWGSDQDRTLGFPACRTDSHISISPREIETSQFDIADILEQRKHVSRGRSPQLQRRNVFIYKIKHLPSPQLQSDLALERYGITRNVRVLYCTQDSAWCVGISEPFISRTFPGRNTRVVAHHLSQVSPEFVVSYSVLNDIGGLEKLSVVVSFLVPAALQEGEHRVGRRDLSFYIVGQ